MQDLASLMRKGRTFQIPGALYETRSRHSKFQVLDLYLNWLPDPDLQWMALFIHSHSFACKYCNAFSVSFSYNITKKGSSCMKKLLPEKNSGWGCYLCLLTWVFLLCLMEKSMVKIMLTWVFRFYLSISPVKVLCNGPQVSKSPKSEANFWKECIIKSEKMEDTCAFKIIPIKLYTHLLCTTKIWLSFVNVVFFVLLKVFSF